MTSPGATPFLTAEWRFLAMLNYVVDPSLLAPLRPRGTELDFRGGHAYVSLVGFRFERARIRGIAIPFHQDFEEINLRFYVRRRTEGGEWRRAVVFIREIVPRVAIAWVARLAYNEPYLALPTSSCIQRNHARTDVIQSVTYGWRFQNSDFSLQVRPRGEPAPLLADAVEEFITEHYWGYTVQRDGSTMEYQVEHPRWRVWQTEAAGFQGDAALLYGRGLGEYLCQPPASAFLAEGSPVKVWRGRRLAGSSG